MSIPHGTLSTYTNHKCRCDDCTAANREYQREYKRKRLLRDPEYRERLAELDRRWTAENPEKASENAAKAKARAVARNKRIRQEFLDEGCLDCGSAENLHFHHVDPSTKTAAVSFYASTSASVERLMAEIEKCVVVCETCHLDRHARMRLGLPQEPPSAQEA